MTESSETWSERVRRLKLQYGEDLPLEVLLEAARDYKMTEDEIKAQRESWSRQDMN